MLGTFETFECRGQSWTRFPAPPADEAFVELLRKGLARDKGLYV